MIFKSEEELMMTYNPGKQRDDIFDAVKACLN
jgi:hypothetical protein